MLTADGQNYKNDYESLIHDKDLAITSLKGLLIKNIEQLRSWTSTLLTIDAAIIGATLAVLSSTTETIVKVKCLAEIGLAILFVDALYIVCYTSILLAYENTKLSDEKDLAEASYDELIQLQLNCMQEHKSFNAYEDEKIKMLKQILDKPKIVRKWEPILTSTALFHVMSLAFIAGVVSIVLSLISFQ